MKRWLPLLVGLSACVHRADLESESVLTDGPPTVAAMAPAALLAEAANNGDPTPRARAVALLVGTDLTWGARGLLDPDPWVQRHTADALIQRLPQADAAKQLAEFAVREDSLADPFVRATVAAALVRSGLGTPELRSALSASWKAEHDRWRRAPLALAAAQLGDNTALAPLQTALAAGDVPLEVEFLLAIAGSGLVDLIPALRTGSSVAEEELALPWAAAQAGLGDREGEAVLRRALTDPDEWVRLEALDVVVRLPEAAAVPLIKHADGRGSALVRSYAAEALASFGKGDLASLERAMGKLDRDERLLAVQFAEKVAADPLLAKRGVRTVRKVARTGLTDEDPEIRARACAAIGALGVDGERALLEGLLQDDYLDVRIEAAGALLQAGQPERPGK